jgi:hypothetical protein
LVGASVTTGLAAQTATPPTAVTPATETKAVSTSSASTQDDEVYFLSPFEVNADRDVGYAATQTLAGTRIRTDLKDVGSAISVVTKEFMNDIGATDTGTLLQYTTNAEVAGTRGTYAGLGNDTTLSETGSLRAPGGAQRVRGLASADNTRDFFVTDIPWDSFNVDRIDIQRGPNSILFGLGSPAGIVNASTRSAVYNNSGSVEARYGSYGTVRGSIDVNRTIIDNVLAVRIDGMWSDEKYQQKPAFQNDKRVYGTVRWDPKLFGPEFATSIKAKFENGKINANRPRILPPYDSITPWFRAVDATSTNGGVGKYAVTDPYTLGTTAGTQVSQWLNSALANQQQPIWFINGSTDQTYQIYAGYINTGARKNDGTIKGSSDNLIAQKWAAMFYGLNSFSSYAVNSKLANWQSGQYKDITLSDSSIFNFYDNLIDGNNKREYENWNAYNIDVSQTGWGDRAGLEFSYDWQHYERGGWSILGYNPAINIDVTKLMQDGSTNANFGRPFINTSSGGNGSSYESDRQYVRGSVYVEFRASDILSNDFLVKLIGRHRFNGVFSQETYDYESRSWAMNAFDNAWDAYWTRTTGNTTKFTDRPPVGIIYLGQSLANATSAAGASIPRIMSDITMNGGSIYEFDSTWKASPSVNYSDPWVVPSKYSNMYDSKNFDKTLGATQASNPDNYVGWNTNKTINLVYYGDGNLNLLTGAQKTERVTTSYAGSWQGFMWNDAIVPILGWRYDKVKTKGVTAASIASNKGILNLDPNVYTLPDDFPANAMFSDHSLSGGAVIHINNLLPKSWEGYMPLDVSLSYNESSNFQVTSARRDIYGNTIGNPTGKTKEYGVLLSTKDGKYSFHVIKYETKISASNVSLNNYGLYNTVQQGLRFRNVFLYKLATYPWDSRESTADRNTWATSWIDANGRPVASGTATGSSVPSSAVHLETDAEAVAHRDASIRAWNSIQSYLTTKGYFAAWGYTPTTLSALTDRSTYEAAKIAAGGTADDKTTVTQYTPDPNTVYGYGAVAPQGFTVTADTRSKGYEFELTANPTSSWRIALNASKTEAIRTNVGGPVLDEFVSYIDEQMAGVAGDMRQYSGGYVAGNEVRMNWNNWRGNYTLLKLQEKSDASELRKWRFNLVTNYSFKEGFLKGFGIGAAYRWQDKVVIGYPVHVNNKGVTTFDLSSPFYGPSEGGKDFWISYEHPINDKINWKIQLNVRNAFEKNGLIPISVEPDGMTYASCRIKPVQEWFLTNTFTF